MVALVGTARMSGGGGEREEARLFYVAATQWFVIWVRGREVRCSATGMTLLTLMLLVPNAHARN